MSLHTLGAATSATPSTMEFLVLRQDASTRAYRWLGLLSRHHGEYEFRYRPEVAQDRQLGPLPGFTDKSRVYRSTELFATFANRVMTPRRDSYRDFLAMLGLHDEIPDPFEVLARTWGTRATDRIQVLPVPRVDDRGRLRTRFLVHGGRHVDPGADVLRTVNDGDRLALLREPANPEDPLAVLVCAEEAPTTRRLGYIPAPLAPFIHSLWRHGIDPEVSADRVNLPEDPLASNQMRLLARLEATVGADFDVMGALDPEQSHVSAV